MTNERDDRRPRRRRPGEEAAIRTELDAAFATADWERCVELLGRLTRRGAEHPSWQHPQFLEWLAIELREREERRTRVSDADFVERGETLLARVQARRARLAREDTPPIMHQRRASVRGESEPVDVGPERFTPIVDLGVAAGVGREIWDEEPAGWVELPAAIPSGDYIAFRIAGDSMSPLMHTGDTVLVQRGPEHRRDTVVVARHPEDGYVCKCVRRIGRDTIELGSLAPDGPTLRLPRDARLVVGTVVLVWCTHHRPHRPI